MKIKVIGCSVCKIPYDWSFGIHPDLTKEYVLLPMCINWKKHDGGYSDELIEVEINDN